MERYWTGIPRLRRSLAYLLLGAAVGALVLTVAALETFGHEWRRLDPPLHSTIEGIGALAALAIAWFLLERRREYYTAKRFLLALGFFGMGVLDLFHAVTVPGHGFVLLHSVANVAGGSWFALTWLPQSASDGVAPWKRWMPWAVVGGSVLFGIWTLAARETLPVMVRDGAFTPAAIALNVLAGAFFVGAATRLLLDFHRLGQPEILFFGFMATLFGLANLMFPYSTLWDSTWWLWHLVRLTAYLTAMAFAVREHQRTASDLGRSLAEGQRSEEEMLRRNRYLSALYSIRRASAQSLDLEQVLTKGVESTLEALGMEAGGIVILEPDGETMTLRAHRGLSDEFVQATARMKVGEGISGRAAAERKAIVLDVPDYPSERLAPYVVRQGFQTLASAPLLSGGEVVGALSLATRRPRAFAAQELDLLTGIGELLGGAVQNAQLHDRVQRELAERKRADEALRETRDYLEKLLDYASAPIIVWDPGRKITRFNHAFEHLTGYAAGELVGIDLSVLFPEASRVESLQKSAQTTSGEYWESVDVPILRKDGAVRLALWNSANIYGQDGVTLVATIAQGVDITERTRMAEESRMVLRSAMDGFLVVDMQERFLEVNEAYCRLVGYTRDELLAMRISDIDAGESPAKTAAHIATIVRAGSDRFLTRHRRKDGAVLDVEISANHLPLSGGRFFCFLRDVTEQKRAEGALRLQSAALNAAANGIVISDRQGTIVWVNPAFTTLTGHSADDAIGKNPRELVKSGVHDQAFYKRLWDTILAGNVWHGEMTNRRKDGSLYSEDLTITPVKDARGEITHFIAIKRDRTEQKRLQAEFLQAQKMEIVGRLASGIAHDFNNLLTVINGTADLALMNLREDEPLRADFEGIHRAGDRAAALTRQLLAFSRKQIMKFEVLNLSTLLADVQGMLQRMIGEDIDLVVVPAKDVGSVMADRAQIEQVVMNLAVNARDAMPNGGTLTMETRDVELDEAYAAEHPSVQAGPHVLLAISDTGVGMEEATRRQIFEPFFTTKELGKGTGLGLSTVYGIVKQSGGSIWVYSELEKGTAFKIYLPRVEGVEHKFRHAPTVTSAPGTETILIVEDDETVRHLAKRVLQAAGYTVLTASNGADALLLLGTHNGPVHLVLTDMIMPGMSGRDLAAQLEDIRPQAKVLYTSGYTDDAILRHGVLDGVTHFIGKPYTVAELRHKVREVLGAPGGRRKTRST